MASSARLKSVLLCGILCTASALVGSCVPALHRAPISELSAELQSKVRIVAVPGDIQAFIDNQISAGADPGKMSVSVRPSLEVDSHLRWLGPAPAHVPFRFVRGLVTISCAVVSPVTGRTFLVDPVIDSGAGVMIRLSAARSREIEPWLAVEVAPAHARTAFGHETTCEGVLGLLRIETAAELAPVQVTVGEGGHGPAVIMGLAAMEQFGGIMIDWGRSELVLWPPESRTGSAVSQTALLADTLRADRRWVPVRWSADPIHIERAGPNGAMVATTILSTQRWLWVETEGKRYRAVVDTGAQADMIAFAPVTASWARLPRIEYDFSGWHLVDRGSLEGPVALGPLSFNGVTVKRPSHRVLAAGHDGIEVIIGLGMLCRHPIWMDFQTDTLRFWASEDELPVVEATAD